jgi:hypothetical protein
VFAAIIFGAMSIGQASQFAPDYGKAKLAATRIFNLIDQEPVIDSYSLDGAQPVCMQQSFVVCEKPVSSVSRLANTCFVRLGALINILFLRGLSCSKM